MEIWLGLWCPFLGTALGAAAVFLPHGFGGEQMTRALSGAAAGVMTAASVWSLLLPAITRAAAWGKLAFVPAAAGVWTGVVLFLLLDALTERTDRLTLAVTVHNLPEGIAVGVALAGFLSQSGITSGEVIALTLGVAAQNIPEGAILSLPKRAKGASRGRSFAVGALSGLAEPLGAAIALLAARLFASLLPFLLAFAAGAMLFVTVTELIPSFGGKGKLGTACFALGFTLMMALDVALG